MEKRILTMKLIKIDWVFRCQVAVLQEAHQRLDPTHLANGFLVAWPNILADDLLGMSSYTF